jgi:aspartate/methionine/tyrosine aminotransferase
MTYKHDFSWGDTRGIREIMIKRAPFLQTLTSPWELFGYPPHDGLPELRIEIEKLILDLTGKKYTHILITGGATHALNAYAIATKNRFTQHLCTNSLYFSRYPGIATNTGLIHRPIDSFYSESMFDIRIVDSPSNPLGQMSTLQSTISEKVVWDAAYYSPTYCGRGPRNNLRCHPAIPAHEAMVGSLSKLTGLNGLRIGWLATNKDTIYDKALEYVTSNLCGVSYPSQFSATQILKRVNMPEFYLDSKDLLDSNKEELSKLDYLFGNQVIPDIGMFCLLEVDDKLKKLFEKASLKVMPGTSMGDTRDSVRFNLANSVQSTKDMVKDVLKADKN